MDRLIPPHPAHVLSCGRGVEALVLAMLEGQHALYTVGQQLAERGMVTRWQPGLTRASLPDDRLGHILDALFAANRHKVFSALARKALEVYAIPTPWRHQDTTTMALDGADEDEPEAVGAPRPAYGHRQDGRDDRTQGLLSLGVSGDGGLPVRVGLRDGHRRDRVETPLAMEACLALGVEGVRGIVAASQASSRRTVGRCLERGVGFVTLVPRTCAVRQELAAWGQPQPAFPLFIETPGRTQDEAPRRWHGPRVIWQVEVEDSDGRLVSEALRCVVGHSSPLAPQQTQPYASAQATAAGAVAEPVQRVHARWLACEADAAEAMTAYERRGPGRRGRRPQVWRYHVVR